MVLSVPGELGTVDVGAHVASGVPEQAPCMSLPSTCHVCVVYPHGRWHVSGKLYVSLKVCCLCLDIPRGFTLVCELTHRVGPCDPRYDFTSGKKHVFSFGCPVLEGYDVWMHQHVHV